MATRSRTTFQKRQKEIARAEKQRDKVARRLQRKLNGDQAIDDPDAVEAGDEENLVNGISAVDGTSTADAAAGTPSDPNAPSPPEAASAPAAPAAAVGRT